MDADTFPDFGLLEEDRRSAMDQICRIGRQTGFAAGQLDAARRAGELQSVEQVHRVQDGLELVKTVGPPAQNVEQQVDLTRRLLFEGLRHKKAPTSNASASHQRSATGTATYGPSVLKRLPGNHGRMSPSLKPT